MKTQLSIVMPVLDEAASVVTTLRALAPLRARGHELVVVDGGSQDLTVSLCKSMADRVLSAPRGRARQMNAGAAGSRHGVLLFLHADTILPDAADSVIERALRRGADWGRFDVRIEGRSRMYPLIACLMNARSRWTGIATGDQAMFVRRGLFEQVGGFPDQPLMEDVEISCRLRELAAPACLRERVTTSGRRWERRGVWRTIFLMWRLRWRYWRGGSPEALARDWQ